MFINTEKISTISLLTKVLAFSTNSWASLRLHEVVCCPSAVAYHRLHLSSPSFSSRLTRANSAAPLCRLSVFSQEPEIILASMMRTSQWVRPFAAVSRLVSIVMAFPLSSLLLFFFLSLPTTSSTSFPLLVALSNGHRAVQTFVCVLSLTI